MIAPSDIQPRAAPRFQIYFTGSLRGRQWPTGLWREKNGEEPGERDEKGQGGREDPRGRQKRRDSYHLARLRRRLTQRGYRGRLDGHIEGARST